MRFASAIFFCVGMALNVQSAFAADAAKLTCSEVAATKTKCQELDAESAKCDVEVQAVTKSHIEAAKTAADECKKKNGIGYMLKCKKELAASAKAINTPKQVSERPILKELTAKPESACAKAEVIGAANVVCKGPKQAFEALERNCIKDAK